VPDPIEVQRALTAAGFQPQPDPSGRWVGFYHLAPLSLPGAPLQIEIHSALTWPDRLTPPNPAVLFDAAVESAVEVAGISAPAATHHALLLAAHSWAHNPLGRIRDLLDVAALLAECDAAEASQVAQAWGLAPMWRTTTSTIDALLAGRKTWPLRIWAAHLPAVRVQTVVENHLERLLSPFWGYPAREAPARFASALIDEVRPVSGEDWRPKLGRTAAAFRRGQKPVTKHRRLLGDSSQHGQRRNPRPDPDAQAGPDSRLP
jgi:hypothetical protein